MNTNFTPLRPFFFFALLIWSLALVAQPPAISYQSYITGLSAPVDLVNAGDGTNRLFIVEQAGTIRVWNGTTTSVFGNFAPLISSGGEQGLLSMAFHPDYNGTTNRFFFIYYTNTSGDIEVSRYQTTAGDPNTADLSTGLVIITIPHPVHSNHNGGKLNFGSDGYLYFATGDGGSGNDPNNNAQNGASLLGKMLRINIDATRDCRRRIRIRNLKESVCEITRNRRIRYINIPNLVGINCTSWDQEALI